MDPTKMTTQEAIVYAALINAGIGFVLGLIPLITGFVKRNIKYGLIGFVASIVGGAVFGIILAIPASVIFTWLIIRGAKKPVEVIVVNQEPIDVSVNSGDDQ